MKAILIKTVFFCFIGISIIGCEKDNIELKQLEGYIVGFDPCTINHHYRIGYVIVSTDLKDTLRTFNLSDTSYQMPASVMLDVSDTLYQIPESYFQNYWCSAYFPESAQSEFKVKVTYTVATDEELTINLCTHDINQSDFNNAVQVIIKTASKY